MISAYLVGQTTAYASLFASNHWSSLTVNSPTYDRLGTSNLFYYEAIQVVVGVSGLYSFRSISDIDTYGYFYENSFNPLKPMENLLTNDDDSGNYQQFLITIELAASNTYVLVFTTYIPTTTTMFVIIGLGPDRVNYVRLNNISTSIPTTQMRPSNQTLTATQPRTTTQTQSTTNTTSTLSPISCKCFLNETVISASFESNDK